MGKNQKFKDYLNEICFRMHTSVLDDDMPDFFYNWLMGLASEDYIKWADFFGREMYLRGKEDGLELRDSIESK